MIAVAEVIIDVFLVADIFFLQETLVVGLVQLEDDIKYGNGIRCWQNSNKIIILPLEYNHACNLLCGFFAGVFDPFDQNMRINSSSPSLFAVHSGAYLSIVV